MGHEPQARAGPERESPQETPLQSKEPDAGLELVTLRPGPKPNQESDTLPTECLGAPRGRTARENALRTAVTLHTGGRAPATTPSPRTHPLLQSGPPRHREDPGQGAGGPDLQAGLPKLSLLVVPLKPVTPGRAHGEDRPSSRLPGWCRAGVREIREGAGPSVPKGRTTGGVLDRRDRHEASFQKLSVGYEG